MMDTIAKNLILQAIQEGVELAPHVYAEQLERRLAFDVALQEADGDVSAILEEQAIDELLPYCEIDESTGEIHFNEEAYLSGVSFVSEEVRDAATALNHVKDPVTQPKAAINPWLEKSPPKPKANSYNYQPDEFRSTTEPPSSPITNRELSSAEQFRAKLTEKPGLLSRAADTARRYGHAVASGAVAAGQHIAKNKGAYGAAALGAAALAGGAYALYKHLNSPKKIQDAIAKTKVKLNTARQEKDAKKIDKYTKKLKILDMKMDALRKRGKA